jgi:hypothetical protein
MVSSVLPIKNFIKPILILLTAFAAVFISVSETDAKVVVQKNGGLGVIKGVVRDNSGKPIANATVAFFRVGTSKLLKQVLSNSEGSFLAKIVPGTYSILAVAEGFNPVSYSEVEVNRSKELVYKFNLEPSGKGNTLPEKKAERNSSKYPIRQSVLRRSIYQIDKGDAPIDKSKVDENSVADVNESVETPTEKEEKPNRKGQTVVETYFAGSDDENYTGFNFATLLPVTDKTEIVVAGQTGTGESAPNRLETSVKVRANEDHNLRFKGSIASLGTIKSNKTQESLGQFSFQALDEWKVREGIILVYGFDYSRFVGAGNESSISPRFGLQFDVNSKTRFRTAYTTATEERTWQRAIDLEGSQILFREPVSTQDVVIENNKPQLNKSSRLEFGLERVLDNKSNIEANVFFDAVNGRGVGLDNLPFDALNGEGFSEFVVNQQGKAQGLSVVYTRRLNGIFSASAGYAFGNGQKLSAEAVSNPANAFVNDFFQTFVGAFDAELSTGTSVRTIFRLSPQATVFAIDPFAGRMAIYDPGLSVLVTQSLPNWGLPIRAEAIIDARNLFDIQSIVNGEEGSLRLNSQRRILRGGISVRF